MSEVFFTELGMRAPKCNLGIGGGGHGVMTGRMLAELERVMLDEHPEVVLVYGDTNSTLAGALAAVKLHIPVAHLEAGLRSFNMKMPEEINRVLTDRIARWLFTPTEVAAQHLCRESVAKENIFPVGDVMYDVALHHSARVQPEGGMLAKLGLSPKNYVLATVHRAENTNDSLRMTAIIKAMQKVADSIPVVWPLHPRTRRVLAKSGQIKSLSASVHVIEPVGYLDMVQLGKYAALIATDSGGVEKRLSSTKYPCVTLRDETEWVELVEAGWNRLVPPVNAVSIVRAVHSALGSVGKDLKLNGNGDVAVRIVSALLDKQ
jgi:UDP-GlcNAc3NAcA epimerase